MSYLHVSGLQENTKNLVKTIETIQNRLFFVVIFALMFVTEHGYATTPYTWIDQCDKEIGATVPAFSCTDLETDPTKTMVISAEAPKKMLPAPNDTKCEKPEILNTRCVHKSRVGRIVTEDTKKNDVDIIFSCRKNKGGGLHLNDKGKGFWDIAVIQHSRKNGKTCFYQHLDNVADADDKEGAPASNSDEGKKFWDFRVNFCTECHTNGPFIRSPHYWLDVKDGNGDRILPKEGDINDKKYSVVHPNPAVANVERVDKDGNQNACNACHNIGAYFKKNKWRLGEINLVAAGIKKSLSGDSPTATGFHDFMADEYDLVAEDSGPKDPKVELQALQDCLAGQTKEEIDQSIVPKGCKITTIYKPTTPP